MNYIFICKQCGNIQDYNEKKGTIGLKCSRCSKTMGWESSFPVLAALNFEHSAQLLLEQSKKQDKDNLNKQMLILEEDYPFIDKTFLDKWINKYETFLEKYPDNDDKIWIKRDDEFENIICNELGIDMALSLFSAIQVCNRNYYRKPYIIMVASLIEQLFNDYFNEVVKRKLPTRGTEIFINKYKDSGIQSIINVTDIFLDESLKDKMDKYSKGFFDKWSSLRNLRNNIIHSNNIYVSKNRIAKINKMVGESYNVFKNLKSELYSNS